MIYNSQRCRWQTQFLFTRNFIHEVFCSVVLCLYIVLSQISFGTRFVLGACLQLMKRLNEFITAGILSKIPLMLTMLHYVSVIDFLKTL